MPVMRLFRETGEVLDVESSRVLLVGEMRHFRLEVPHAAPTGFNSHPLASALERSPDPVSARLELRALGFTHVIVDAGWVRRSAAHYPSLSVFDERPELLGDFVRSLGQPLAAGPNMALFEIPK